MFIDNQNQSPLDLHWRMFGVSVRVQPFFWLCSALLGSSTLQLGIRFLVIWIACVFVSILLHELGHVLVGRIFGTDGYIILHGFGGVAVGSSDLAKRWQRVAVYLAGTSAQFLLLGLIKLIRLPPERTSVELAEALYNLEFINWYWPVLNLLPILPLDGGQVSREFFTWLSPRWGMRAALVVSAAVAATLGINSASALMAGPTIPYVYIGGRFTVVFFGLLAVGSIQALNQMGRPEASLDDQWPHERQEDEHESWQR